ncbi:hypothetical protein EL26_10765 [Tumebacillus flagellatus]|uniref:Uncharacterized protein n=1 Tax=Tumebacillus flagellatus TaxID=1157490 RepID=A0A074LSI1_9BACL|nr:hypothetical protein EL26_10765 [Tumebacillus flagellatus]
MWRVNQKRFLRSGKLTNLTLDQTYGFVVNKENQVELYGHGKQRVNPKVPAYLKARIVAISNGTLPLPRVSR